MATVDGDNRGKTASPKGKAVSATAHFVPFIVSGLFGSANHSVIGRAAENRFGIAKDDEQLNLFAFNLSSDGFDTKPCPWLMILK